MTKELRPEIIGLGKSRGSEIITREQTAQIVADAFTKTRDPEKKQIKPQVLERLMRKVGIDERGWLKENEGASHLGVIAIRQALDMVGMTISDVKAMAVATGLPDYLGIPTGTIIAQELGGNEKLATMDISGACPGFIHALRTVYESLSSSRGLGGPQVCVAAEPASKGISPQVSETYVLFGDAGGAFVMDLVEVESNATQFTFDFGINPKYREDLYVPAGGSRRRVDEEVLAKNLNCIQMDGEKIKKAAIESMSKVAKKVLIKAEKKLEDIDLVIPHQANLEIIHSVARELEIPAEKLFVNIQRYGNTSAASIPVAVREAWEEGKLKKGDTVLAVTFGAGLNFAAAVLPMNGLPENELREP